MTKEDQKIIVVKRNLLLGTEHFEGFKPAQEIDYESRILKHMEIMRRGTAEKDLNDYRESAESNINFKQPIGYTIIYNPSLKKVFAYQRSTKNDEDRLHNKWSWGFGGHIEPFDKNQGNVIRTSTLREVTEEVEICGNIQNIKVLGYINSEKDFVSQVHFGILYLLETNANTLKIRDPEIAKIELKSIEDLIKMSNSPDVIIENWSKIALNPLQKIIY